MEDPNDDSGMVHPTESFFDSLDDAPSSRLFDSPDDPDDPLQQQLAEDQAAHAKIAGWLSTFHGAEPESAGNLRGQVSTGKISGADYFTMTGRIYAGSGKGDKPGSGLKTGSLGGPSSTPGLDRFHEMNPGAAKGKEFSFMPETTAPLPKSVAAKVGPPKTAEFQGPQPATGIFADRRFQTPYGPASVNFSGGVNRSPTLPTSLPKSILNNAV